MAAQSQRGEEQSQEYKDIKDEIAKRESYEDHRLLYVACTRAVNHLYLFGSVKPTKTKKDVCTPRSGTFLRMLWHRYQADFQGLLRRQIPKQSQLFLVANQPLRTSLRRAPLDWHAPVAPSSVSWNPTLDRGTASNRTVTYEWVSGTGRHIGTIVHAALKQFAQQGSGEWKAVRIRSMQPLIEAELKRLGVSEADRVFAIERVSRALINMIDSERGKWILGSHEGAQSEVPIQGRVGNRLITGTVDRLFRESGSLWIIDYKTSEHQGGSLENFLNEEVRRYRSQMESYGTLLCRVFPGPVKLGLYFPLLDAWKEWLSAETAVPA